MPNLQGEPESVKIRPEDTPEAKYIPLTGGLFAVVDSEDYGLVSGYRWATRRDPAARTAYASAQAKRPDGTTTSVLMHRLIIKAATGQIVDHANGNGLDNRKSNLRVCTQAQNSANKRMPVSGTGFRGVRKSASKLARPFEAVICPNGKPRRIGQYDTAEEAAKAYDGAARKHFGRFARLNFPGDGEFGNNDPRPTVAIASDDGGVRLVPAESVFAGRPPAQPRNKKESISVTFRLEDAADNYLARLAREWNMSKTGVLELLILEGRRWMPRLVRKAKEKERR